ncbi:MAG: uncharacterized protein K0S71_2134 [Clostridia bacterium]|jgi:YegS/Rv2252/BmrU family lipid kinase|nr:uncharacterized protein [Clostridia bacterium]
MKHLFIINPLSGKKDSKKYVSVIEEYFKDRKDEYIIEFTQYPGHAKKIAEAYSKIQDYRIYSIGGDGTLNEVLSGMAGTGSVLGVLPGGSCNDFLKSLNNAGNINIASNKNIGSNKNIARTIEGEVISIDCARTKDNYFINILSVGIDADTAYEAAKITRKYKIIGMISYILGLIVLLFKTHFSPKYDIRIILDDEFITDGPIALCVCTNGKYYGGGFSPIPFTKFDDGFIDVCYVEAKSLWYILKIFPKFMKGTHLNEPGVHLRKARKVTLECKDEMKINLEGEILFAKEIEFEVLPKYIQVIRPSS